MLPLADAQERALIEELKQMRELVQRGMSATEQSRWMKRIARLEGVLFWKLADSRASRIRVLEKSLAQNKALLADVDERIVKVANSEAEFTASVETDFMVFADRARDIRGQVTDALTKREVALADEIRRGMQREMREVQQYLLVTRIAIARATDKLAAADLPTETATAD